MSGPLPPTPPPLVVSLDLLPLAGEPSGVGAFCGGLLGALRERRDVEVGGYAVALRPGELRRRVPPGVPLRTLPFPQRAVQLLWRHGALPSGEEVTGRVGGRWPDVVHGTNFVVPPCRRAAEVVTVHDLTSVRFPELCAPASLAYPRLVRRAVRRGAFVHTHSRYVAEEVVSFLDAPAERVRAISPGVVSGTEVPRPPGAGAVGPAQPVQAPFPWPYLLAVGTIEPRKGYPTLVEAFSLAAAGLADLRLVVVGADGWGSDAFEQSLSRSPARERVVRAGYLPPRERDAALAHALALVYPSLYEGFGLPPLEAMAAGVPVVASDAGSLPEVLGEAALVVPAGDAGALAGAIARVVGDEDLRRGLVERGRARVASLTWEAAATEMVGLYRDASEARR